MVFQEPNASLNPCFSIGWQIAESLTAHRAVPKREVRARVVELLRQVGIPAPETKFILVGHSMGGLVARTFLSENPEWADRIANKTGKPRFVAGAIGPLTVSLSNSPDADDAGFRVVTFDQVKAAYLNQVRALIAGGSDILLVETIFDSLNAKAALVAIQEVFEQD